MPAMLTGETMEPLFVKGDDLEWQQMDAGVRRTIVAYDEKIMMVRVAFEKEGIGALHRHQHIQISNVESGVFEIEMDGKKVILKAGDAFYVPANCLHGAVCLEAGVLIDVFSPMREDFLVKL